MKNSPRQGQSIKGQDDRSFGFIQPTDGSQKVVSDCILGSFFNSLSILVRLAVPKQVVKQSISKLRTLPDDSYPLINMHYLSVIDYLACRYLA